MVKIHAVHFLAKMVLVHLNEWILVLQSITVIVSCLICDRVCALLFTSMFYVICKLATPVEWAVNTHTILLKDSKQRFFKVFFWFAPLVQPQYNFFYIREAPK